MSQVTFTFRTNREVMDKFKYLSEYNGRSANRELEQLVLKAIKEFESNHGVIVLDNESTKK